MSDRSGTTPDVACKWYGGTLAARVLLAFCRWLPEFRGKRRLFDWYSAIVLKNELDVRTKSGVRLTVDPSDYIGRTIAFKGGFESRSLRCAASLMGAGGLFVDVGCNFGLYIVEVGPLPGVQCIAIDGSFVALNKLHQNLCRNPGIDVRIVNGALAPEVGIYRFEVPEEGNLGGTRVSGGAAVAGPNRFWVVGTALETVLNELAPGRVKLLKIDVEGFELQVFRGLDFQGRHRPENIIMECDLALFPNAREAVDYLLAQGYEANTVDGDPIRDYRRLPENNLWLREAER